MTLVCAAIIIILAKGLIEDDATKAITLVSLFIFLGIFLNPPSLHYVGQVCF